jgi:hypothetical protein
MYFVYKGVKIFVIFVFIYRAGVESSPLLLMPFIGLSYQPWTMKSDDCGAISGMNDW